MSHLSENTMVSKGCGCCQGSLQYKHTNSYLKTFLVTKKERAEQFFDIDDGNDGTNRNLVLIKDDPLNPGPLMRP
jgi:hypothetical protein